MSIKITLNICDKVMATQRWKAVKMKQKFDRQRFQNFSGSYSDQNMFISKGGSEREIYVPEEGADTGLFASVLQVNIETFLTLGRFLKRRDKKILMEFDPSSNFKKNPNFRNIFIKSFQMLPKA